MPSKKREQRDDASARSARHQRSRHSQGVVGRLLRAPFFFRRRGPAWQLLPYTRTQPHRPEKKSRRASTCAASVFSFAFAARLLAPFSPPVAETRVCRPSPSCCCAAVFAVAAGFRADRWLGRARLSGHSPPAAGREAAAEREERPVPFVFGTPPERRVLSWLKRRRGAVMPCSARSAPFK